VTAVMSAHTRVDAWRARLLEGSRVSSRFADRYSVVLAKLEAWAVGDLAQAWSIAAADPARAARILAGTDLPTSALVVPPDLLGPEPLVSRVRDVLCDRSTLWSPLVQTNVPLHPARNAHGVRSPVDPDLDLVALTWSATSVPVRQNNERRIQTVAATANKTAPLPFVVGDQYVLGRADEGDNVWVFAPNLGPTLEDRLRSNALAAVDRYEVVESLAALREAMLAAGLVWQGFAPRNMFLRDRQIVLIDFEEVADARADPARAAECLMWHRVFFADCLDDDETQRLFRAGAEWDPHVDPEHTLRADPFERALLNTDVVTWQQRRMLLEQSAALEGRHTRPTNERDGGVLYGHELGHFWGDFLAPELEARLFARLNEVATARELTACIEAFEAAMEADIVASLLASATGTTADLAGRTAALVELVDSHGTRPVAQARDAASDWYARLRADPGRLIDTLLFALSSRPGDLDQVALNSVLVGSPDARDGHEAALADALRLGVDFLHAGARGEPLISYASPHELRAAVSSPLPQEGDSFDVVLADVQSRIARYAIGQAHTRYLAFPDAGNALAALAGSMIAPLLNQNLIAVDRSAPSATFVEIQVVEWLRELVGYPVKPLTELNGVKDVAGLWTTGGHLSNHVAMLAALGHAFPTVRDQGLRSLSVQPVVVMAGPIAHYSHSDAAYHLGLGRQAVLSVGAQAGYTTDPQAVDQALTDPGPGRVPFMVVGVAGNCRTTGLDDLRAIGEVCRRHGVWFHVDACHGGSLIFNDRLRRRHLDGIELADSVALDPHKGLFTPYPSSYIVFRERGSLTQFSRHAAAVLADDCWDLGLITPFLGSRGFASLATWMLLRHVGTRRLGQLVEARQALVRYLERRITDAGLFVCLNDVDFYRLTFVLCPPAVRSGIEGLGLEQRRAAAEIVSAYTSRLNTALYRSGEVCFDEHTLADLGDRVGAGRDITYTVMAACPGNVLTTRKDLDAAVDRLVATARELVPAMLADLGASRAGSRGLLARALGPAGWSDGG
jgi:glutamate/tyrosine decarboxylase-like PLP-dependent enzyme